MVSNLEMKKRIWILVMVCVVFTALLTATINVHVAGKLIDEYSTTALNTTCQEKTNEINKEFAMMKQSVDMMADYASQNCPDNVFANRWRTQVFMDSMEDLLINSLQHTESAYAAYIIFNNELASHTGVFATREDGLGIVKNTLTNIDQYSEDSPLVAWYYQPIKSGEPCWITAYSNKNMKNTCMISYVIPIYFEDTFVAVLGMDMKIDTLKEAVKSVNLYDSGYAILTDSNGDIVYHPNLPSGLKAQDFDQDFRTVVSVIQNSIGDDSITEYEWKGVEKVMETNRLDNGMYLSIMVPVSEIQRPMVKMARRTLQGLLPVIIIAVAIAYFLDRSMDSVTNTLSTELAASEEKARKDALTGIGNKFAFLEAALKAEKGDDEYGILMMDVNDLKRINDAYGHVSGDQFLLDTVQLLRTVLPDADIYRFGGDEFAAIIPLGDRKGVSKHAVEDDFLRKQKEYNIAHKPWAPWGIWVAVGFASSGGEIGRSAEAILRAADMAMYENKLAMKRNER